MKTETHSMKTYSQKQYLLISIFLFALLISGCSKDSQEVATSKSAIYFDTPITITIYHDKDNLPPDNIFQDVFDLCSHYQNICDAHTATSELGMLNNRTLNYSTQEGIDMYLVSEELYDMVLAGINAHTNYSNQFDITIAPLISLWNFSERYNPTTAAQIPIPDKEDILETLVNVDSNNLILCHNEQKNEYFIGFSGNNPNIAIDLGGLAKGYVADKIKEYLLENDINSALIDLGGNIYALGTHLNGDDFTIGIKKPYSDTGEYSTTVNVTNKCVITSGIYERYFDNNGTKYHHILSPSTGYPASCDLLSVSIISDSSLQGDILSTTCLLIGKDLATELVEGLDNTSAIMITTDYEVITVS